MNTKTKTMSLAVATVIFFLLASHATAQTCTPPPPGITAWWPLDEETGTTAADIIGGHPGIQVSGPAPTSGQVDGALHFTRPQYIGVADSDLWAFGRNDFTIEFWARFDGPGSGSIGHPGDIFIGSDEGPGLLNKWFFALGGGVLNFHINGPGVGSFFLVRAPFTPIPNQWYHLGVTRRLNTYTVFVNGTSVGSESNTAPVPNASAPLTIGQAEGIAGASGFMDGALDEVTIYNRSLSPNEFANIYNAGVFGKCRALAIATRSLPAVKVGEPAILQLRQSFGIAPYAWSVANGFLPPGIKLSPDGLLSGTPTDPGTFQVTIRLADSSGQIAEKDFTLNVLLISPSPAVRINKIGTITVPGRTADYFLIVENAGGATARDIEVAELLDPLAQFKDPSSATPPVSTIIGNMLIWRIDSLEPGDFKPLSYSVTIAPSVAIGDKVKGQAAQICDQCRSADPCFFLRTVCSFYTPPIPTGISLSDLISIIINHTSPTQACYGTALLCLEECKARCPHASHDQSAQGPVDPNEKLVVAKRFVRPEQTLVYPIHFENIGTIEARDVFVSDMLDPALDEATLNMMTPHGASYDASTRTLQWDLLNMNLPPGKTGNVFFAIKPRQDTPSGTVIRNAATIKFEVFASLDTNQVETVIDTTPPNCVMGSLPARSTTLAVPLTWIGTDPVGEIDTYSVLVSTNGGPYAPLVDNVQTTSTTFQGAAGNSYGFICISADTAGNVEVQQAVAETTTLVQPDTTPPIITISASPAILWPPNGSMVSVSISGRMTDTETGVDAARVSYAVSDEYGRVHPSGIVALSSDGGYSFKVSLQALRDGTDRDGRRYSITVKAQDNAGNAGLSSVAVTVPHDRR